ncbi:unnamed protein product [Amoebophrya sp. A25]|nr:unnamed protein product [Amoebophrya sp. A25]|eukprot:GSA25T00024116001.1
MSFAAFQYPERLSVLGQFDVVVENVGLQVTDQRLAEVFLARDPESPGQYRVIKTSSPTKTNADVAEASNNVDGPRGDCTVRKSHNASSSRLSFAGKEPASHGTNDKSKSTSRVSSAKQMSGHRRRSSRKSLRSMKTSASEDVHPNASTESSNTNIVANGVSPVGVTSRKNRSTSNSQSPTTLSRMSKRSSTVKSRKSNHAVSRRTAPPDLQVQKSHSTAPRTSTGEPSTMSKAYVDLQRTGTPTPKHGRSSVRHSFPFRPSVRSSEFSGKDSNGDVSDEVEDDSTKIDLISLELGEDARKRKNGASSSRASRKSVNKSREESGLLRAKSSGSSSSRSRSTSITANEQQPSEVDVKSRGGKGMRESRSSTRLRSVNGRKSSSAKRLSAAASRASTASRQSVRSLQSSKAERASVSRLWSSTQTSSKEQNSARSSLVIVPEETKKGRVKSHLEADESGGFTSSLTLGSGQPRMGSRRDTYPPLAPEQNANTDVGLENSTASRSSAVVYSNFGPAGATAASQSPTESPMSVSKTVSWSRAPVEERRISDRKSQKAQLLQKGPRSSSVSSSSGPTRRTSSRNTITKLVSNGQNPSRSSSRRSAHAASRTKSTDSSPLLSRSSSRTSRSTASRKSMENDIAASTPPSRRTSENPSTDMAAAAIVEKKISMRRSQKSKRPRQLVATETEHAVNFSPVVRKVSSVSSHRASQGRSPTSRASAVQKIEEVEKQTSTSAGLEANASVVSTLSARKSKGSLASSLRGSSIAEQSTAALDSRDEDFYSDEEDLYTDEEEEEEEDYFYTEDEDEYEIENEDKDYSQRQSDESRASRKSTGVRGKSEADTSVRKMSSTGVSSVRHYGDHMDDAESFYTDEEEEEEEYEYYTTTDEESDDETLKDDYKVQPRVSASRSRKSSRKSSRGASLVQRASSRKSHLEQLVEDEENSLAVSQSVHRNTELQSVLSRTDSISRVARERLSASTSNPMNGPSATSAAATNTIVKSPSVGRTLSSKEESLQQGRAQVPQPIQTLSSTSSSPLLPKASTSGTFVVRVPLAKRALWEDNVRFAWSRSGKCYVCQLQNVDKLAEVCGSSIQAMAAYPGARAWQLLRLGSSENAMELTGHSRNDVETFWRSLANASSTSASASPSPFLFFEFLPVTRRLSTAGTQANDFSNLFLAYDKYGARVEAFAPGYPVGWQEISVGDRIVEINGVSCVNRSRSFMQTLIREHPFEVVVQLRRKVDGSLTDRIPFKQWKGCAAAGAGVSLSKAGANQLGTRTNRGQGKGGPPVGPNTTSSPMMSSQKNNHNVPRTEMSNSRSGSPSSLTLPTTAGRASRSLREPNGNMVFGGESLLMEGYLGGLNSGEIFGSSASAANNIFNTTPGTKNVTSPTANSTSSPRSMKRNSSRASASPPPGLRFKPGYGPKHDKRIPVDVQYEMPSGIFDF